MNNSDETLDQPTQTDKILQAIAELSKKVDDYKKESDAQFETIQNRFEAVEKRFESADAQFEAIRLGIVHNSVAFDRLNAEVLLLRANVKELTEEVRHNKKVLV